jgi:hypothetical protein
MGGTSKKSVPVAWLFFDEVTITMEPRDPHLGNVRRERTHSSSSLRDTKKAPFDGDLDSAMEIGEKLAISGWFSF